MIDPGHNVRNRLHPTEINRPVFYGIPGQTKPCDTTGTATASGFTEAKYNLEVRCTWARSCATWGRRSS